MATTYQPSQWLMPKNANTDKVGNYSFDFDGTDDYINIGTDNSLDIFGSDFTISLWAKWGSQTTNSNGLVNVASFTNKVIVGLGFSTAYGKITFGTGTSTANVLYDCGSGYDDDNWHHIVCIEEGGVKSVYVDNVDITGTGSASSISVGSTNDIGVRDRGGQDRFFVGKMSEISVFNYVLSAPQITTLYGDATDGVGNPMGLDPVPVGYWKGDKAGLGAQWAVPNQVSQDYVFDFDGGDDYIDIGTSLNLGTTSTVSLWLKQDTVGVASGFLGENTYSFDYLLYVEFTHKLYFRITTAYVEFGSADVVAIMDNITDWIHIMVVRTGDDVELFLNGNSMGTVSGVGAIADTRFDTIGAKHGGTSPTFGKFNNVACWNSDQSANITTIFNNGTPGDLSSLSPISWWKLDDSATFSTNWSIPDDGSASNTGTSSGMTQGNLVPDTVTRGTAMYSEYSFDFDGVGDIIDMGNPAALQITGDLSISLWVKSTDATDYVLLKKDNIGIYRSYALWGNEYSAATTVWWAVFDGVSATSVSSATSINDGDWHHVVAVYEPSTALRIYIDGVLDAENTTSIPASINNTAADFQIGGSASYYMDGTMNNVAVWNSTLTASNILAIYNNGRPADLTSLSPVSWWKLGEEAFCPDYTATPNVWEIPDQIGSSDGTSAGNPDLVGEAPQSFANGLSVSMDIDDRIGESGFSDSNALSYNMDYDARVEDVPA